MSKLRVLSLPQRLVLVVGLGLLLLVACAWWYAGQVQEADGWFTTLPDVQSTDTYFVVRERQPEDLVMPVAAVATWMAASVWLLGLRPRDPATDPSP